MALTRAMLIAGNSAQGVVLPGQPQGVIQGAGINISTGGIISVDASSVTGLVKLNNPVGYNAYQWPSADGTTGQFLQTNGAGILTWAEAKGFAVVTVQSGAPSPADIGELWFDCATGTLNVYQNCVGTPSPNWFNVAQPGLPVLPGSTSAAPAFVSGTGTSGDPYVCNATTVPVSGSAFIVNTVSVSGLAPYQYVPIADLAGVANGGRFSFSNYYADASGTLTFNTIFNDVPGSPVGTVYTANIKIGYGSAYVDADVTIVAALTTTAGSIAGTPQTGSTLTYTTGVASGGTGPYTYAWVWQDDLGATLQTGGATYVVAGTDVGRTISVVLTATDAALANATATTAPTAIVTVAPFPSGVWSPTPAGGLNTIPGLISGTYSGTGTTITSTGCIEVSTDGTNFSQSEPIASGQTLYSRWITSPACGDAATGTNLTGDVTDGTYENSYAVTVNRKPNPALANVSDTGIALGATTTKSLAAAVAGLTTTAYITLDAASTGTTVQVSTDNGTTFVTVPSAPSTLIPVNNGVTLQIRQTVGSTTSTGYIAAINIGDSTGSGGAASTYQTVTYTATTVSTAVFPGVTFSPVGGPNAAPEGITGVAGGGALGTLEGFAPSNAWPAAYATTLSSPGGTPTMKMRVGANAYATSGVSVAAGNVLDIAWNQAYLDTVTSGSTATGSIQGTVGATTYTNTFSFTVERAASFTTTSGAASGASGTITLVSQTPDEYNVPVKLYQTVPGSDALTSVTVDIDGNGPVPLPTTVGTALTLNPGETVVFAATAPGAPATYTTDIHIGDTVNTWSYQVTVTPTVSTPIINNPTAGTTVDPTVNTPSGITVTTAATGVAGGFQTNYGGTQTDADWYVYKANLSNPETSAITVVNTTPDYPSLITTSVSQTSGTADTLSGSSLTDLFTPGSAYLGLTRSVGFYGVTMLSGAGFVTGAEFTLTFTSPVTVSSSLKIMVGQNTGGGNSSQWSINGGALLNGPAAGASAIWLDTGFTGNLTSIRGITTGTISSSSIAGAIIYGIQVDGEFLAANQVTLTLTDATDLADMVVGDVVRESGSSNIVWSTQLANALYPENAFDGNTATFADNIADPTAVSSMTWTPASPITVSSSFRFFQQTSDPTTKQYSINGGAFTTTPNNGWVNTGFTGVLTTFAFGDNRINNGGRISAFEVDGTILVSTEGTITAIDSVSVPPTITLSPSSGTWSTTQTAIDISRTVIPPAPPALPPTVPDATKYTAVSGFPLNLTGAPFNQAFIPQADLAVSSTYYASVIYTGTGSVVSTAAAWSDFDTVSAFAPAAGTAMAGGYFGGQILLGTTLYNLIVAPVRGDTTGPNPAGPLYGQNGGSTPSGIFWKNANTGETGADIALAQNDTYGKPWTDQAGTTGNYPAGTYPLFQWCKGSATGPNGGGGIGGFTDWYIPSAYEIPILYFFLKPDSTANSVGSASNPYSVSPYTPNTGFGPGFPGPTTADGTGGTGDFLSPGAEEFATGTYWSSTETSSTPTGAYVQNFSNGSWGGSGGNTKASAPLNARAIRRVLA